MAMITANNKYKYDQIFRGITLDEWVQAVHKNNAEINNWKYFPLKKGAYGYDNLAIGLGNVFYTEDVSGKLLSINEIASIIHDGWIENYLYWRDNEPWLHNRIYHKPSQKLGDSRRNLCASTAFNNLPDEEKNKDIAIAKYII